MEGTEDSNLLLKEYELLSHVLHEVDDKAFSQYRAASDAILLERDRFIAQRIKNTLKQEETGLAFIGVRHKLDQELNPNFALTYVIYRLPFQTVKKVYNL